MIGAVTPDDLIGAVRASTERFLASVHALGDDELREPAALPGWTRAHVVSHVAANARAYTRLLTWAATGVPAEQYPSREFREREIEIGAQASPERLVADLDVSVGDLDVLAASLAPARWRTDVRAGTWWHPAWHTLVRRWREVEVHHVDLAAGYTPEHWPADYLATELVDTLTAWRADGPAVGVVQTAGPDLAIRVGIGPDAAGRACDVLAWLAGRTPARLPAGVEGLPRPAWPLPMPGAVREPPAPTSS